MNRFARSGNSDVGGVQGTNSSDKDTVKGVSKNSEKELNKSGMSQRKSSFTSVNSSNNSKEHVGVERKKVNVSSVERNGVLNKKTQTRNKVESEDANGSRNSNIAKKRSTQNSRSGEENNKVNTKTVKEQVSKKMKSTSSKNKNSEKEDDYTNSEGNINAKVRKSYSPKSGNRKKTMFSNEDNDEIIQYDIFQYDDTDDMEEEEDEEETEDVENIVIQSRENEDTISLDEIRETLETKVDTRQKKENIKEALINIGIAIVMVLYLILVIMGSKNINVETLQEDMKIMTLSILFIGIVILEMSYKKDNVRMSVNGIEVIAFGMANLCLVYTVKLSIGNLMNIASYLSIGIGAYYLVKSIVLSRININKYKKDNSDIKEIIKK